ncbi:MAG: transcriptional activator domain [Solirubrobacterales bacterium]|nr:transcriptional activator domain [Solirubrobacterales bacterium]
MAHRGLGTRGDMLRVSLLGELVAHDDDRRIEPPASRHAWALLGYLALHPGAHFRTHVATDFWPDVLDSSARASLRNALWALRRALGPVADEVLLRTSDRIALAGPPAVWVDIAAFDAALDDGRPADAVALCRGDMLEGLDEGWVVEARDTHRTRQGQALRQLADATATAGDHAAAIGWARRAVGLDPLSEEATRLLMAQLVDAGDHGAALTAYERLRDRLARELQAAPSATTRRLARDLRSADRRASAPPPPCRRSSLVRTAHLPNLVGRDAELAQLTALWSQTCRHDAGALALISGEAGIGKSRLVAALAERARADGATVAACAGPDLGSAPPFGLWAELLDTLLLELSPLGGHASWATDVASLVPSLDPAPGGREAPADIDDARLMEAVVRCLRWAAARSPLVLVLEDLHAADTCSVRLVSHAARRLAVLPVLFVLTRRDRPIRDDLAAVEQRLRLRGLLALDVPLGRLADGAIAALAHELGAAPEDLPRLVAAADGNALLATESARALRRGQGSLPDGLRDTVRAAFAGLGDDARALVQAVAVAGPELSWADAVRLACGGGGNGGRPAGAGAAAPQATDAAPGLGAALDSGLLTLDGEHLGFRHGLLRDAVYAQLDLPARQGLHLRLAALRASSPGARASPR